MVDISSVFVTIKGVASCTMAKPTGLPVFE